MHDRVGDDDPSGHAVRFATIGSYKGLEADAVIVADISDLESDVARQLLYVGLSRARAYLCVLLSESTLEQYQERAAEYGRGLFFSRMTSGPGCQFVVLRPQPRSTRARTR